MLTLIYNTMLSRLPYRKERRRAWPRVLGWVVAVAPFGLLMLLTFNMEFLLKLAKG
jgi:hypothetical protein